jgi:hypothetical protein
MAAGATAGDENAAHERPPVPTPAVRIEFTGCRPMSP